MTLNGMELHGHAIRLKPDLVDESIHFYQHVLRLSPDSESPQIPEIPVFWMDWENDVQILLFGVEGRIPIRSAAGSRPVRPSRALGVPGMAEAGPEPDRLGVPYWRVGRDQRQQLFIDDPSGNQVELHEIDSCCKWSDLGGVADWTQ
jgi:hypothetical protein